MKSVGVIVLLAAAGSVLQAAPVTWYLSKVTFDDGGRAFGSFVYDADTGNYAHINIQTTPGPKTTSTASPLAGGNYSVPTPAAQLDSTKGVAFVNSASLAPTQGGLNCWCGTRSPIPAAPCR